MKFSPGYGETLGELSGLRRFYWSSPEVLREFSKVSLKVLRTHWAVRRLPLLVGTGPEADDENAGGLRE